MSVPGFVRRSVRSRIAAVEQLRRTEPLLATLDPRRLGIIAGRLHLGRARGPAEPGDLWVDVPVGRHRLRRLGMTRSELLDLVGERPDDG